MAVLARDLMQRSVLTLSPEASLLDAHRLFVEEEITGAPVVRDDGTVAGVVTSLDLLRAVSEEHDSAQAHGVYFREALEFSGPDWSQGVEDFQDRLAERRVSEVMTESVVVVPETATVSEVARTLRANRIHRVLVVRDHVLVGILSTFDLVGLLERAGAEETAHRSA